MAVRTEEAQIQIIINGSKATSTIKEMESAARILNAQIKNLTPGTQEFIDKTKQLQDVNARLKETKASVKGVDDAMGNLKGSTEKTGGFMGSFFGNLAANLISKATDKIIDFGKQSVKAYEESLQSTAQLEASLKSTGGAAGITKNEITNLSSQLQALTNIDDDVTNSAASLLLTFTDVKNKAFKEAIPLIQDMAVKMAGGGGGEIDLKSATIQVGKALNDPIKGVTALSKVGVSFTEQQKIQIATMQKSGDLAGAQAIILAELRKEFGGSAEAAAIAAGGMGKFNIKLADFSEWLGSKILPVMNKLGDIGSEVLDNINPVFNAFSSALVPVKNLWSSLSSLVSQFIPLKSTGSGVALVMKAIGLAIDILLAPTKLIYTAVIAWVDSFNLLLNIGKAVIGMESDISGSFDRLTGNVVENTKAIGGSYNAISSGLSKAADAVKKRGEEIRNSTIETAKSNSKAEINYRKLTISELNKLDKDEDDEKARREIARRQEQKRQEDEKKKAHEKQLADFRKAEDDYDKDILSADKNLQKLRLDLYGDSLADQIKKLEEQGEIEKALVKGTAIQQQTQRELIEQKTQQDIAALKEKYRLDELAKQKIINDKKYQAALTINTLEINNAKGNNSKLLKLQLIG
jgi:uncharacterized protein YoxC